MDRKHLVCIKEPLAARCCFKNSKGLDIIPIRMSLFLTPARNNYIVSGKRRRRTDRESHQKQLLLLLLPLHGW